MVSVLDSYVFICPERGEEFESLEDYLEYSSDQHDYWISDCLGCSYHFGSIEAYQDWVREELINKGKSLQDWKFEQQQLSMGKKNVKTTGILLFFHTGELSRLSSTNIRKFARRAKFAREIVLA